MKHIMLDLETLGTRPTSVFPSIAAIQFDLETGGMGRKFYAHVDLEDAQRCGLTMDISTIQWWMEQKKEALNEMLDERSTSSLKDVLLQFYMFVNDISEVNIWGNSARFDIGILENAYRVTGIAVPWSFRNEKCYRTLVALYPDAPKPTANDLPHHPLLDCKYQIQRLHSVWQYMNKSKYQDSQFVEDYSEAVRLLDDVTHGEGMSLDRRTEIYNFLQGIKSIK